MTVKDLKELLDEYDDNMKIAYRLYSEYCLLEEDELELLKASTPRNDGWVHSLREDKDSQYYLLFPGN